MGPRLQRFDFRSSAYERPGQNWVCGRMKEGRPCSLGPAASGACSGGYHCRPLRTGDRWSCTRSAQSGGRCAEGPGADGTCARPIYLCRPRRSARYLRRSLAFWTTAVILVAFFALSELMPGLARTVISPGPLSTSHVATAACEDCHGFAFDGSADLLTRAVHGAPQSAMTLSCAGCHPAEARGAAHSLMPDQVADMTAQAKPDDRWAPMMVKTAMGLGIGPRSDGSGTNACLTCHSEHDGREGQLTAVGNDTCNRCHRAKIAGISRGHPPLTGLDQSRRLRIRFDHKRHFDEYFAKASKVIDAPRTCRACHQLARDGARMEIKGFDAVCGACHDNYLSNQVVAFLALPELDLETLDQAGRRLGQWPEYAGVEALPPLLDLLLAGDADYVAAREALRVAELDLFDLTDAAPEDLDRVESLVWSLKGLIADLVTQGPSGLLRRLRERYDPSISEADLARLAYAFPRESIARLQKAAFPDLLQEIEAYRSGKIRAATVLTELPEDPDDAGGGWQSYAGELSFAFDGHDAAIPGARWLTDLAVTAVHGKRDAASEAARQAFTGKGAPGRCTDCHSVDSGAPAGAWVNWRASASRDDESRLTVFRHAPHVTAPRSDCKDCHGVDPQADFAGGYADDDPASFAASFLPLTSDTCARCHNPERSGDRCLDCHDYHAKGRPLTGHTALATRSVIDR